MSNARNISDVFNNANTADNLTILDGSAKLPDAVFPATLPAVDGSQLTGVVEARPTITSISPDTITNSQTSITVTGTNYVNGANIEAVATNGAIIQADTVTFNSSTSISAAFTITTDGTYYLRIENPDGLAVRSATAILTVSDAPTWSTAAGSLGSMAAGSTANFTVAATSDSTVSYSVTSGALPGGLSLNSSTGAITGTESGTTAETTYNFTVTATDLEAQTADRAFSITVTVGINNGGQFN